MSVLLAQLTPPIQPSGHLEIHMSAAPLSPGSRVCKIGEPAPASAPVGGSQQQKESLIGTAAGRQAGCARIAGAPSAVSVGGEWSGSENAWGHRRLCRN